MQDKCSFCGRNRNEVNLLIAGTDGFICDECASQAYDIVQEEMKSKSTLNLEHIEVKAHRDQSFSGPICHWPDEAKNTWQLPFTIIIKGFCIKPVTTKWKSRNPISLW